jgi:hypothetical protein
LPPCWNIQSGVGVIGDAPRASVRIQIATFAAMSARVTQGVKGGESLAIAPSAGGSCAALSYGGSCESCAGSGDSAGALAPSSRVPPADGSSAGSGGVDAMACLRRWHGATQAPRVQPVAAPPDLARW